MPTTGSWNLDHTIRGPVALYHNAPIPVSPWADAAATSKLTLTWNATKELFEPATGHLMGVTSDGLNIALAFTSSSEEVDEITSQFNIQIDSETFSIEGNMMGYEDFKTLTALMPTGTYKHGTTPANDWEVVTFGGTSALPAGVGILAVGRSTLGIKLLPTPMNLPYAVQMYNGLNVGGFAMNWTRRQSSRGGFRFEASPVSARDAKDRLGCIYHEVDVVP
jgi:hypothetical protein